MSRIFPALGLLGLTAACALPPEGVSEAALARYDSAVTSLGCTLVTEPDYLAAGIQTGLTREQLLEVTAYKLSSGAAERLPDGGIKLTTGACA
jgi:hypothetical protein